jgi:ketosteroid isomerase-like protein
MADDIHFRFLGEHSWAADFRSKDDVEAWFARYLKARLRLEARDIAVSGPPWNSVIFTRFIDEATDSEGNLVYENEGVLLDRVSWGRIREHVAYEDTQRTAAFDAVRGVREPAGGVRDAKGSVRT